MSAPYDEEFTLFVQEYARRLQHGAELLVGDRSRAQDLVQQALVGLYLRWPRVREGNPYAYARRAMLNQHLDWWRRVRRREGALPEGFEGIGDVDPAVDVVRRDAVQRALTILTRRERAVIVLRYWFDLSEVQIAEELRIAPGTVKSTAHRALGRLRQSGEFEDLFVAAKEQS